MTCVCVYSISVYMYILYICICDYMYSTYIVHVIYKLILSRGGRCQGKATGGIWWPLWSSPWHQRLVSYVSFCRSFFFNALLPVSCRRLQVCYLYLIAMGWKKWKEWLCLWRRTSMFRGCLDSWKSGMVRKLAQSWVKIDQSLVKTYITKRFLWILFRLEPIQGMDFNPTM